MAAQPLSTTQLRMALLARQGLLEPFDGALPRAIERFGGLQTQYSPSPYVGLRERVVGFERDDLTKALERKSVVQGTLMRGTIHMVARADYWPFASAVREQRRTWWLRVSHHEETDADMHRLADKVRSALAVGPRKANDLKDALGLTSAQWNGVGLWLDLVRVPPSGTWDRRRADLYDTAENWIGPDDADPTAGTKLLVKRYLRAFGPASVDDVARYINFTTAQISPIIDGLPLRTFVAEDGTELVDVRNGLLPDAGAPVRRVMFLGTWDSTMLVHVRRTLLLPEEHRYHLFHTKVPQSVPPVLVDGQVRASWRYDQGKVTITPFETLSKSTMKQIESAARGLAAFHQ